MTLSKLQCIIDSANTPYVFILGDFNADIQNISIFGAELLDFCDNNTLCFLDKEFLSPDLFTYISQAHGTPSWLDHCITTTSGKSITSGVSIIDNIVCSDHFPLCELTYTIDDQLDVRIAKFTHMCLNHHNDVCRSISLSKLLCKNSTLASNFRYLSCKYSLTHHDWHLDMNHLAGKVRLKNQQKSIRSIDTNACQYVRIKNYYCL